MLLFTLRRLIQSLFVLLAVSIVVFLAVYAVGDPVELLVSPESTVQDRLDLIAHLGLNQPIWKQYLIFLWGALHGDLGNSFVYSTPAIDLIISRMPATFELVVVAIFLTCAIGIPLGLVAGLYRDRVLGRGIMATSVLGYSLPNFWQGMMLILMFAVWLGWLPASGRGDTVTVLGVPLSIFTASGWRHIAMPAVNLALGTVAVDVAALLAGVSPDIFLFIGPFNIITSCMVHANLDWTFGPFARIFVSPVFHRWHHAMEVRDVNFASTFSLWDWMFGTYHMPQGVMPQSWHPLAGDLSDQQLDQFLATVSQAFTRDAARMPGHADYLARFCAAPSTFSQSSIA